MEIAFMVMTIVFLYISILLGKALYKIKSEYLNEIEDYKKTVEELKTKNKIYKESLKREIGRSENYKQEIKKVKSRITIKDKKFEGT